MTTTSAPASERILQIRNLDPELKRKIKIECATSNVTVAALLEAMWLAYERIGRGVETR